MLLSMISAHLVSDFVLQTNALARRKAESLDGLLFHGLIVIVTTMVLAALTDPSWWLWALIIGLIHICIDTVHYFALQRDTSFRQLPPFIRLIIDQLVHVVTIGMIVFLATKVDLLLLLERGFELIERHPSALPYFCVYVFVSMPAWILTEMAVGALTNRDPNLTCVRRKYFGIAERLIALTLIILGQGYLVAAIVVARLLWLRRAPHQASEHTDILMRIVVSMALTVTAALLV